MQDRTTRPQESQVWTGACPSGKFVDNSNDDNNNNNGIILLQACLFSKNGFAAFNRGPGYLKALT